MTSLTESFNSTKNTPLYKNEQKEREIIQWRLPCLDKVYFSLSQNLLCFLRFELATQLDRFTVKFNYFIYQNTKTKTT